MFVCELCHTKSGCGIINHVASSRACEVCRTVTVTFDCHRPAPDPVRSNKLACCTDCRVLHSDPQALSESTAKMYETEIKRWNPSATVPNEEAGFFWATCGVCKALDEAKNSDDFNPGVRIFQPVVIDARLL